MYVPGVGVETDSFCYRNRDKNIEQREEIGIPPDGTVILSVGELIKRKNHRVTIEAIKEYDNVWYIICGQGPLYQTV